jgi:hypothetical protein
VILLVLPSGTEHTIRDVLLHHVPLSNRARHPPLPSIDPSLSTFNSVTPSKMALRLPRRHAQRQALHHEKKTSVSDLRSKERQQHKPLNTKNQRVGSHRDSDSRSKLESNSDVNTNKEVRDSRYNSNTDNEAEYLNELVEHFKETGLQMLDLRDVALEMIQKEKRMF